MSLVQKSFSDIITFTRASGATRVNASGVLETVATNFARLDYDPSTLAPLGLLIEEQRTNSIRNNTMQGALAGTPGTMPTNWAISSLGTLTQQVVGTGISIDGITYVDIRFSGTTSTTQLSIRMEPNGAFAVAAANGQTWTTSMWSAIVGGSLTNITSRGYSLLYWDGAGGFIGGGGAGTVNSTLNLVRTSNTVTIAQAGTAFIQPQIYLTFNSGVAIDITLRIGLPQLEQGAFATSVIPTTGTAATRNADSASITGANFSSWYNATEGTLFSESQILYSTGGTIFPGVLSANNGTTANQILMYYINTNKQTFYVRNGGTVVADIGPTATANIVFKSAGAYKENDFAATTNGLAVSTDTAGALPPAADRLNIGTQAVGSQPLNGWVRRIAYYPRRLTNAELQALTA